MSRIGAGEARHSIAAIGKYKGSRCVVALRRGVFWEPPDFDELPYARDRLAPIFQGARWESGRTGNTTC